MRLTIITAAVALYLSRKVHATAWSLFYTRGYKSNLMRRCVTDVLDKDGAPHLCGQGLTEQPTEAKDVSPEYDINDNKCLSGEPNRTHFWVPRTNNPKPHCLELFMEDNCEKRDWYTDFVPLKKDKGWTVGESSLA